MVNKEMACDLYTNIFKALPTNSRQADSKHFISVTKEIPKL